MFINCPYCSALVATDPVTDLPPTHCPHCTSLLRRDETVVDETMDPDDEPIDLGDLLEMRSAETPLKVLDAPAELAVSESLAEHANVFDTPTADGITDRALAVETTIAGTAEAETPSEPHVEPPTPAIALSPPAAPAKHRTRNAPSFVHRASTAPAGPRERWIPAVAVALALLLALQLLLADRARLASNPTWRPLLSTVCAALFCDLPPWREPAAFSLLQRDVRQHPSIPGVLRVSATFRNDARWSQPWPRLQLTLSDVNGRRAGERSFRAEEYLGGPPNQAELASGESATIAMDLHEPAARIVAYDFKFR